VAVVALQRALLSAASSFSILQVRPQPVPLNEQEGHYGSLYAALTGDAHEDDTVYPLAVELIYEGYLLHYRQGRVASPGESPRSGLLAGDYLYARGLRLIASQGDVAGVELLTSLMAVCSYFRSESLSFSYDDDVWAFTVAGLAALRQGCPGEPPAATFARVERAIATGAVAVVPRLVREGAAALHLRDAHPLEAHLSGFVAGAA
jgi:hypothetical protein